MTPGKLTPPIAGWQRANVLSAAEYLRDLLKRNPAEAKAQVVYEGLLEVLDPVRRAVRQQRELAGAAKAAIRERRSGIDRRVSGGRRPARRRRAPRRRSPQELRAPPPLSTTGRADAECYIP
jgi:hypothetical protein